MANDNIQQEAMDHGLSGRQLKKSRRRKSANKERRAERQQVANREAFNAQQTEFREAAE